MTRRNSFAAFAVVALYASTASAVNRCEIPGAPPIYQDRPCPASATSTTMETQKEREARLRKEAEARAAAKEQQEKATQRAREDAALKAEMEAQRARDAAYKAEAAANPKAIAEAICRSGIKEKMPGLEPAGEFHFAGKGYSADDVRVIVAVRLADSFRAAPVGLVECNADVVRRSVIVTKIRM